MKLHLSNLAIIIVVLTVFCVDLSLKHWEKDERVIEWDVHNYYAYLPAIFIYDDIEIDNMEDYRYGDNNYYIWAEKTKDDRNVVKGPIGMIYPYAPFFFAAHITALFTDYASNGYSEPYKVFLLLSTIFFLILGLELTKKILFHFNFSEKHTAITILIIGLGTNLLAYSSLFAPLAHVYNFTFIGLFMYYTIKWHEAQKIKYIVILGLVLGLITLIRPTNGLVVIIFLLYGVYDKPTLVNKWHLIKKEFFRLNLIVPLVFLIWIPQFWYWKVATGNYLYYSFGEEGFYFTDPKIIDGLFSFRKGWITYTPLMILSIIGFYFLRDKLKKILIGLIVFFILNIYIIFSWWCWWYGGTIGQRSMIDSYVLLAIPLAALIQFIDQKKIISTLLFIISLFLIWLNIFQIYQFENKSLHYDSMSKELYFKQFGKLMPIDGFDNYLDWANYEEAKYRNGIKKEEKLPEKSISSIQVHIVGPNGKYLCTEWDRNIISDKDTAQGWEVFTLNLSKENELSIVAYDDYLLSADLGMNGELTATRKEKNDWETFTIEYLEGDFVAFKTSNNKYWSLDSKTNLIATTADKVGVNERFRIIKLN